MPAAVARQFAVNLRKARRRAGLSQEEVGWLASLHRTEIGLLETGARTPRIDTLVKIAAAVDVPVSVLCLMASPGLPAARRPERSRSRLLPSKRLEPAAQPIIKTRQPARPSIQTQAKASGQ